MAQGLVVVTEERAEYFQPAPVLLRCTAPDALSNLVAVLELSDDHQLRCSAATRRPLAATVRLVEDVLVGGDYYDGDRGEPIAAASRGPCCCRPAAWPSSPGPGSS